MPQVVVPAFVKASFFVAKTLALGGLPAFALRVGASALLSVVSSKLFGPDLPEVQNSFTAQKIMSRSAIEHRKIGYGQFLTSGPVAYNNTSGVDLEYLWYQVAMLEGESDDLVEIRFDKQAIPKADIDWVAGTGGADGTGTGAVSTAKYIGENSTNALSIFYYNGDTDQPVCGPLNIAFSDIDGNHRLRGVTHVVARLLYDEDTEEVWKEGPPTDIAAVWKGRKVYDPRLDSTNGGSGTHRYATPSTWEWSDTPALCVTDYLMTIMNVDPATSIDWPSVAAAADDCETLVAIPTAATEKRFTCNGQLSLGASHKDNLDALLSSMDGKLSYTGGVWKLRASVWEASSVSITEDDIVGDIEVRGSAPESERFNGVRGVYVDPARDYETVEFGRVTSATYLSRDNDKEIFYDLLLPMTNTDTMAQRIAFRNLEQGDNQTVASFSMNLAGLNIEVGDVVDLTIDKYAWSAKTFRVVRWNRNPDSTVAVVLKEDWSVSYDDPIEGNYGTGAIGVTSISTDVTPPPTGLTATPGSGSIILDWNNPPSYLFDYIEVWAAGENDRDEAVLVTTVQSNQFVRYLPGSVQTRYYWIRAVDIRGRASVYEPNTTTTTASAAPISSTVAAIGPDSDFDGASAFGTYWEDFVKDVGTVYRSTVMTYNLTDGEGGSNCIDFVLGDVDGPSDSSTGFLSLTTRIQSNTGAFRLDIKFKMTDGGDLGDPDGLFLLRATGYDAAVAGNILSSGNITVDPLVTISGDWTTRSFIIETEVAETVPYFDISVGVAGDVLSARTLRVDSVEIYPWSVDFVGEDQAGLVPPVIGGSTGEAVLNDQGNWLFPLTEDVRNHGASLSETGSNNSTAINAALSVQDRPVHIPFAGTLPVAETIEIKTKKELNLASGLRLARDSGILTTPVVHMWGDEPVLNGNNAQIAHDITAAHTKGVLLIGQDPAETFGGTTDVSCYHPIINDLRVSGDNTRTDGSPVMHLHSLRRKLYGTTTADRTPTYKGEFQNITLLNGDVLLEFSSDANAHHFTGLFMLQWTEAAILFNAAYGNVIDGLKLESPLAVSASPIDFRYAIIEGYQNYSQIETGTAAAYGISHAADNRISGWAELPYEVDAGKVVALFNHKQDAGPSKTGKTWGNHHYDVLGSLGAGLGRDGLSGNDEVGKSSGRTRAVCWNNRVKEKWGNYFNYEPLDDDSGWIKVEGGKACFGGRKASMVEDFEYDLFSVDNVGPTTDTLIVKLTYAGKESGNAGLQSGEILWHCPVRSSTAQEVIEMYHKPAGLSTGGVLTTKPFAFRVTGASGTEANTGKFTFHLTTDDAPATFNGFCKWDVEVSAANSELIASPNLNWAADISILTSSTSGYVSRPIRSRETKYKADDEDKTLDQTMADDADLAGYVLLADELYLVTGEVWATSEASPDIQWKMDFDQTPQDFKINYEYGSINKVQSGDVAQSQNGLSIFRMDISGYVQTHATLETTAALQWSQLNSNATASTFHKGSYLRYTLAKTLLNE